MSGSKANLDIIGPTDARINFSYSLQSCQNPSAHPPNIRSQVVKERKHGESMLILNPSSKHSKIFEIRSGPLGMACTMSLLLSKTDIGIQRSTA